MRSPIYLTPAAVSLLRELGSGHVAWPIDQLTIELMLAGFLIRGISRWEITEDGRKHLNSLVNGVG